MKKIKLNKEEKDTYTRIVKTKDMEIMFEYAYALGRQHQNERVLKIISK